MNPRPSKYQNRKARAYAAGARDFAQALSDKMGENSVTWPAARLRIVMAEVIAEKFPMPSHWGKLNDQD